MLKICGVSLVMYLVQFMTCVCVSGEGVAVVARCWEVWFWIW